MWYSTILQGWSLTNGWMIGCRSIGFGIGLIVGKRVITGMKSWNPVGIVMLVIDLRVKMN
jgi:hypothetical protein